MCNRQASTRQGAVRRVSRQASLLHYSPSSLRPVLPLEEPKLSGRWAARKLHALQGCSMEVQEDLEPTIPYSCQKFSSQKSATTGSRCQCALSIAPATFATSFSPVTPHSGLSRDRCVLQCRSAAARRIPCAASCLVLCTGQRQPRVIAHNLKPLTKRIFAAAAAAAAASQSLTIYFSGIRLQR